ncbi:MAG: hypothetical protein ACLTN0_03190 [Coprococcus phoceensis]
MDGICDGRRNQPVSDKYVVFRHISDTGKHTVQMTYIPDFFVKGMDQSVQHAYVRGNHETVQHEKKKLEYV